MCIILHEHISLLKSQADVTSLDEHIFLLPPSKKTPLVFINGLEGVLVIAGRSIPESSDGFYAPILDFVKRHLFNDTGIRVYFRITYTNSSSSKNLDYLGRKLEKRFLGGQQVNIFWFQDEDDYDIYDQGEEYQRMFRCPVDLIELDEEEAEEMDSSLREIYS